MEAMMDSKRSKDILNDTFKHLEEAIEEKYKGRIEKKRKNNKDQDKSSINGKKDDTDDVRL
jgi:hypothetical protein